MDILVVSILIGDGVVQARESVHDIILIVEAQDLVAVRVLKQGLSIINMPEER